MATKAAKSITINATKYELANTLGVSDGKMQLKAKDVVLDEAELPAGIKYVVFDFGYEGAGFVSCKDQDGNDVLTAADVKDIVMAGGDIYLLSSDRNSGFLTTHWWKATTFDQWIAADEVKFQAIFPISPSMFKKITAIGTFADNTPTLSNMT